MNILLKTREVKNGILLKWKNEGKLAYSKLIKNKGVTFDEIILGEDYFITTIDIVILMYFYKIPIILLYQQKNKIKTMTLVDSDYYMYIKVKSKKQFLLHVSTSKEAGVSLRFNNDDQKESLQNIRTFVSLKEYFEDNIL